MSNSKAIVMSINSRDYLLIMNKKKTLIIKKTKPVDKEITFPIKVYLYEQNAKKICGYVIVDRILADYANKKYCKDSGEKIDKISNYANGKTLYYWHILSFKDYENPFSIRDFGLCRAPKTWQYIINDKVVNTNREFRAYVDGSFNSHTKVHGSGVVILTDKSEELHFQEKGKQFSQYWNIAGELQAAKLAITKAKELGCNRLTIYHDYEGIGKWPEEEWRAKNDFTKDYVEFVKKCGIQVAFVHVKGHSGNKYNEIADNLAADIAGIYREPHKEEPLPLHEGCVKEEAIERRTTDLCITNIRNFHKKEKRVFADYLKLRVGGKDGWSDMPLKELFSKIPESMYESLIEKGFSNLNMASVIRWHMRGLSESEAIRKVEVDTEIEEKRKK